MRSCGGRAKPSPRQTGVGAESYRNFAVRDARAAARRGTRSTQPATDTAALAYLHIRAPPLHRRSAVLEPSILPVRALLVRDGLTQIRPHREPLFLSSGRRRNRSGSSSPGASGPVAVLRGGARQEPRGDGRVPMRCVCVMSGATARRESASAAATHASACDAKPLYC